MRKLVCIRLIIETGVLIACLVFSVYARAEVNYQLIATTEEPTLSGIPQEIEVASDLGAVYFSNGDGVYSSNGEGAAELLVELGTQALGVDAGVNYSSILDLSVGEGGEIAFAARLIGDGVNNTNDLGVWAPRALGGPITHTTRVDTYLDLAVREGGQAPDFPEGVTYILDANGNTRMNVGATGRIALRGTLIGSGINSTNNEAIWLGYANSLTSVVQTGDTPPDGNGWSLPYHTYTTSGTYDISLIITTVSGCTKELKRFGYVQVGIPPNVVIDATGFPKTVCNPAGMTFKNLSTTSVTALK